MIFSIRKRRLLYYAAIVYLVILNTHSFFLEPSHISPLKVFCMSLAPILFFVEGAVISKALITGIAFWLYCFFSASLHGSMRFSTIGYSGLFVATFIVFYTAVHKHIFTLQQFKRFLKYLILAYSICLVLQQLCILVGVGHFPPINLIGNSYMHLGKLPSLSLEPSHTAVILTFTFLSYLRCLELELNKKPIVKDLFTQENKWISIGFLWVMLTMGSSSAILGLAVLIFYFVRGNNVIIASCCIVLVFSLALLSDNEQLNRSAKIIDALVTADREQIVEADGSGASRIIPLMNTFTKLDLSNPQSWFGHGSLAKNDEFYQAWKDLANADYNILPIVYQYGLIGWFLSFAIVFFCCIGRFFSFETLLWFTLGMASLGNVYYHWGIIMMMAGVYYFQTRGHNMNRYFI